MARILQNGFIQLDDGRLLDPKDPSVRAMCELAALCQPKIVPGGGFRLGGGSRGAQGVPGPQGPQGSQGGNGNSVFGFSKNVVQADDQEINGFGSLVEPFPSVVARTQLPRAGTLRRMVAHVPTNQMTDTTIVTVLVNGAPTGMSVVYAAFETGFQTSDVPFAVAAQDEVSFRVLENSDACCATLIVSVEYLPN